MADRGGIVSGKTAGMRIVGIDPGLNITGYAVVERSARGIVLVEAGMIRGRSRGDLAARLKEIHDGVADVTRTFQPAAMAIEELYSHYERPRTAILMGHARGVICLASQDQPRVGVRQRDHPYAPQFRTVPIHPHRRFNRVKVHSPEFDARRLTKETGLRS